MATLKTLHDANFSGAVFTRRNVKDDLTNHIKKKHGSDLNMNSAEKLSGFYSSKTKLDSKGKIVVDVICNHCKSKLNENDYKNHWSLCLRKKYLTGRATKPRMTYSELITEALQNSSSGMLTISEIYDSVSSRYPYYKIEDLIWKKSLRERLTRHDKKFDKIFTQVIVDKDSYWTFSKMHLDFTEKKLLSKPIGINTEKHIDKSISKNDDKNTKPNSKVDFKAKEIQKPTDINTETKSDKSVEKSDTKSTKPNVKLSSLCTAHVSFENGKTVRNFSCNQCGLKLDAVSKIRSHYDLFHNEELGKDVNKDVQSYSIAHC